MVEMAYLLRCPPSEIAQLGERELATLIDVATEANG